MGASQTMLELQLTGKVNGQDTRVTISIDTEDDFNIQGVGVQQSEQDEQDEQDTATDGEGGAQPDHPVSVSTPTLEDDAESAAAEEPAPEFTDDELPPMTAGTKQFKVGAAVLESGDDWMRARDILSTLEETDTDETWNRSIVTSHIHSLMEKDVFDRRKEESEGVYEYRLTDIGEVTLRRAAEKGEV